MSDVNRRRAGWRVCEPRQPAAMRRALPLIDAGVIVACAITVGIVVLDAIDAWTPLRAALAVLP